MEAIKIRGIIQPADLLQNKAIMTSQIKLKDLLNIYEVDRNVNRDINYNRIPKLIKYISSYDRAPGIFFPSIVCTFNGNLFNCYDKDNLELSIGKNNKLTIIDGQHRLKALESFVNNEKIASNKRESVLESTFTLQIYFGMEEQDQRNLFADINSNSVKVSMSLITVYDSREILNVMTKEIYEVSSSLQSIGVVFDKSRIYRPVEDYFITSVRLKKFIAILLFGKPILSLKQEKIIKERYEEILIFLETYFQCLVDVLPDNPGNVLIYVLGHEAVQNAIALISNVLIFNDSELNCYLDWEDRLQQLTKVDWTVHSKIWNPFLVGARIGTSKEFKSIDSHKTQEIYQLISLMIGMKLIY